MLVTTEQLAAHLTDANWVVFDCRHDLMLPGKGEQLYREGHIPGARFAPVDSELSGPKTGANGRHPLPSPEKFAEFLARHGVSDGSQLVAYDDVGGQYAARLWWMARWIGLQRAALLDGGFPKWVAEQRPLSVEVPTVRPGTLSVRVDMSRVWTADEVQSRLARKGSTLIDARAAERFRGEVEPIDRLAGHIPGAVNRFYKQNLRADLTLRPASELRQEFEALVPNVRPENVGHQCGSGITACANLFAMEYAGLTGSKLYAGSWSEWIAEGFRPVSTGSGNRAET